MKNLVVEMLGARGVGKSTLATLLLAELRTRKLAAEFALSGRVGDKVARQLLTLVDRGRFAYTSASWRPLSTRDLRNFRKRYRQLRMSAVRYSGRAGIKIVDEGAFQLIMELQAKTAQKDIRRIAERMARLVAFPDLVVVVEGPEEAIADRRRRRGNAGDLLRPRVAPWESAALEHTKWLLAGLAASGSGPELIVVENGRGDRLPRLAARLADDLEVHYGNRWGSDGTTTVMHTYS